MVRRGSVGGAENRAGTGAAMPHPTPGKCFVGRGAPHGHLEQQRPTDALVPLSFPGKGKRQVALACSGGDARGSLQTGGFHLLSFLSQPSGPWRKTPTSQSVLWQLRPSSSCNLQGGCRHHKRPCEHCAAAGPAKPGRGAAVLGKMTVFNQRWINKPSLLAALAQGVPWAC